MSALARYFSVGIEAGRFFFPRCPTLPSVPAWARYLPCAADDCNAAGPHAHVVKADGGYFAFCERHRP